MPRWRKWAEESGQVTFSRDIKAMRERTTPMWILETRGHGVRWAKCSLKIK